MEETADSEQYSSVWKMIILVSLNIIHGQYLASAMNSGNIFLEQNQGLWFGTVLAKSHIKIVWHITWELCVELLYLDLVFLLMGFP